MFPFVGRAVLLINVGLWLAGARMASRLVVEKLPSDAEVGDVEVFDTGA